MIRSVRLEGEVDPPFLDEMRKKARSQGLWNMAMSSLDDDQEGLPLSNSDYAPVAEYLGRILWVIQGIQLPVAGRSQHGCSAKVCNAGSKARVVETASGWRVPLCLCHDRACGRVI